MGTTAIWCDPPQLRPRDISFFSSVPSVGGRKEIKDPTEEGRIIASGPTLEVLGADGGLPAQLCRPFALGRLRIELLPGGSMPGAAQLLVEGPGLRALYAGPVHPTGRTPAQVRACHALALTAPYLARSLEPQPPRADTDAELVAAVAGALDAGNRIAVGAVGLDTALEVLFVLAPELLRRQTIVNIAARWSRAVAILAPELDAVTKRGRSRPSLISLGPLDRLPSPAARLTRISVGAPNHPGVDLASPLSTTADLPSLLAFIQATGAVEVSLVEPRLPSVAEALSAAGPTVRLLGPPAQTGLFDA